jgi:hypothetical protein
MALLSSEARKSARQATSSGWLGFFVTMKVKFRHDPDSNNAIQLCKLDFSGLNFGEKTGDRPDQTRRPRLAQPQILQADSLTVILGNLPYLAAAGAALVGCFIISTSIVMFTSSPTIPESALTPKS